MSNTPNSSFRRVAMLFSGGPAPAANAVISTCAAAFNKHGIEAIGMKNGYSNLVDFDPARPLKEGRDYLKLDSARLRRTHPGRSRAAASNHSGLRGAMRRRAPAGSASPGSPTTRC